MTALVGALRVSLSAETSSFEAGMKRSQRQAATSAKAIKGSFLGIQSGVKSLLAIISVGLFTRAIGNALEYASSLAETAQQLGVTAKQLQVYRFAAGQVGVSQEQLEVGLKKLNTTLGQAKLGAEGPKKAFAALSKIIGVDIVAASKQGGDALPLVADAMAKVADRSKRAAAETALMGKSGSALDNLLSGGSKALNELAQAAEKLGIVLSDEQIRHADEAADKLRAVKTVLEANIAGVVSANAQSIVSMANALASLTGEIIKFLGSHPGSALAIIGALAGSRFGPIGVAAGAVAGAAIGSNQPFDPAINQQEGRRLLFHNLQAENKRLKQMLSGEIKASPEEFTQQKGTVIRLTQKLNAAAGRSPLAIPSGDISDFLAGSGKKPKDDHSAEEALTKQHQFDQDLSRANIDILNAKKDLASDYVEQTDIAIQIKDAEKKAYESELQYQVALNQLTKGKQGLTEAQALQLKAAYDSKDALERKAILDEEEVRRAADYQELAQHDFDRQKEVLQARGDIAETAAERRKIELELLQIAYAQRRQALQNIIDTSKDFKAVEDARRDLEVLNKTEPLAKQGVIQQTRGPLEEFIAIANSADKANEALQSLEVEGFNGLIDSVLALSEGIGSATDSILATLKNFLLGLARLELQKLLGGILQGSGGGIGGLLQSIFGHGSSSGLLSAAGDTSASLSIVDLPQFASGGSFTVLGRPGIDKNIMSIGNIPIARVSYGERVNISNDNAPTRASGWGGNTYMTVNTPDANSFRRSEGQITRSWQRRMKY